MKRIALLGFIVFVLPILVVSCINKCDQNKKVGQWTYDKMNIQVLDVFDYAPEITNDTIQTDSVYFRVNLEQKFAINSPYSNQSSYSAMACDPVFPNPTNPIKKLICGIGSFSNLDTSISSSLIVKIYEQIFNWQKDRDIILRNVSSSNNILLAKFLNPHNSKPIHIIMMAIKENGDTLKAVSKEIVLK